MNKTPIVLILPALLACGDATSPTIATVAGSYVATLFTVQDGATPAEDLIAGGGLITLTLRTDRTTSGRLFVPGGGEMGQDFDVDLAGTWTLDGTIVTLDHAADTFLRDMPLTVANNRLEGQHIFGSATVSVELERQ